MSEGKFSVYHAAAVAIVEGAAGEQQFSDEAVRAPATAALRRRVFPTSDPAIGKDQARITVVLKNVNGGRFSSNRPSAVSRTR